jgi:hypothetical protein
MWFKENSCPSNWKISQNFAIHMSLGSHNFLSSLEGLVAIKGFKFKAWLKPLTAMLGTELGEP